MKINSAQVLFSALTCALVVGTPVMAKTITPDEALDRLNGGSASKVMKKMPQKASTILAHTFESAEKAPMVYVFNKAGDNGYVVTPADDEFPALLGYSDSGSFDLQTAPPAMKWFIGKLADEMEFALQNSGGKIAQAIKSQDDENWTPVAPLLTCKWNQDDPYNKYSPTKIMTSSGATYTTVTGCVATSMAQVMYYHKWPDVGVGEHSYVWEPKNAKSQILSCNFTDKKYYDWDNMRDSYTSYTAAQAQAVANLMYACGVSVDMNYDNASNGGSGAISQDQGYALINYFKYSKALRYLNRDLSSAKEFETIIYNNLKDGLPVLYDGHGNAGGHSFVCDGYGGDHFFHFNWGWGGSSDGYFYLFSLDPYTLGIGGGSGGFNYSQGISYNIIPVKDSVDTGTEETAYIYSDGSFTCSDTSVASGGSATFASRPSDSSSYAGFWNGSRTTFSGSLGVIVKNASVNKYIQSGYISALSHNRGCTGYSVTISGIPKGTYDVYPAYKVSGDNTAYIVRVLNGMNSHVKMIVDDSGNMTFTDVSVYADQSEAPDLMVPYISTVGTIKKNNYVNFSFGIANISDIDYYGDLRIQFKSKDTGNVYYMDFTERTIPADMTLADSFDVAMGVDAGEYVVNFKDSYGRELPGEHEMTVVGESNASLDVTSVSPTTVSTPGVQQAITLTVKNQGAQTVSDPTLHLYWVEKDGNTIYFIGSIDFSITLDAGKSGNLRIMNFPYPSTYGESFLKIMWGSSTTSAVAISSPISIFVGSPVEDVTIEHPEIWIAKGDTWKLAENTSIVPENPAVSNLWYASSNPEIATIDKNGTIHAHEYGNTYVTAASHNGKMARSLVKVGTFTGIEGVEMDVEAIEDVIEAVYTAAGLKVLDKPTPAQVDALPGGLYIIKSSTGTRKLSK